MLFAVLAVFALATGARRRAFVDAGCKKTPCISAWTVFK